MDLRLVPQMLGVAEVPVKSRVRDITRYEWLQSCLELALYRFSSIRDISYHLVNELLELNIPSLDVRLTAIEKKIGQSHPEVVLVLREIGLCGRAVRDDRNDRAHEGIIQLGTDDDEMFKNAAMAEIMGFRPADRLTSCENVEERFDATGIYESAATNIYEKVVSETDTLLASVLELCDSLYEEFDTRYESRKR